MEDFESRLTREMRDLVDGVQPPTELRDRITEKLGAARPSRPRWLPAAAAALLVIAGIGAMVGLGDDDGGRTVDLATQTDQETDSEVSSTTADDDRTADDSNDRSDEETTTTTTRPASTVITDGDAVPDDDRSTTTVEHHLTPTDDARPPTTPATKPPRKATTTTTLVCENSTNPACGGFRWSPQPANSGASLSIDAPDVIFVDEATQLTLSMSDPDGPVTFDCYAVNLDRPGTSTGACSVVRQDCPERYGPWSPPAPKPGQSSTQTSVTFDETGTYVISVDVDPPAGCDNVDPYRSGATATLTVEVLEPKI